MIGVVCSRLLPLAAFLFALSCLSQPCAADVTTKIPDCGYLNGRPCTPFDNEAYNIYFGFSTQCDFGLYVNIHNKCVDATRDNISKQPRTWVQWALSEQRRHIGGRTPMNYVTTFGTHNSYASYNSGFQSFITADQKISLYDQLEAGARYVRLDPFYYYGNMRVCHSFDVTLCEIFSPLTLYSLGAVTVGLNAFFPGISILAAVEGVLSPGRLFSYSVRELADWLDRHPGEIVILELHNAQFDNLTYEQKDLMRAPLLEYLGRDRIFTPDDLNAMRGGGVTNRTTGVRWPSLEELNARNKQVIMFALTDFPDNQIRHLAFRSGPTRTSDNFYRGLYLSEFNFPNCAEAGGAPYWQTGGGFMYQVGEDRSASVSVGAISKPVEYLNAPEVRKAARCGVSIINVDFLLGQELSILPVTGQKPDTGEDRRREAAIWSYDEGDFGNRGPAVMKSNGRWTSDATNGVHRFACAVKQSLWPFPHRYPADLHRVFITRAAGPFFSGPSVCQQEYGADAEFFAPATGPENELLWERFKTIDASTGLPVGEGGVWMNYVATMGNLLSTSVNEFSFNVSVPNGTAASQQFTMYGPPGVTIPAPALLSLRNAPLFIQNPGPVTFDSTGAATITIALRPDATTDRGAGLYGNRLLYQAPLLGGGAGSSNQSVISQVVFNVSMIAQGQGNLLVDGPACQGSVCTVSEGQSANLTTLLVRSAPNNFPIAGTVQFRKRSTGLDFVTSVDSITQPRALASPLLPGVGYLQGSGVQTISLPPGSHQIAAYFSGGLVDSPATSAGITFRVTPYLNPNPASRTDKVDPTRLTYPASAGNITVFNPQSRPLTVTADCGNPASACWLAGSGAGTTVALQYTAALRNLAPGSYNAMVRISDGVHATVNVPVSVDVVGDLQLSSTILNLVGSIEPVSSGVTATINGFAIPLECGNPSMRWVRVEQGRIVADPTGLRLGINDASVRCNSAYASTDRPVTVRLQVVPPTTISTVPPGAPITVDGSVYAGRQVFSWLPGSVHLVSVPTLVSLPGGNYLFARWSDSSTLATRQVVAPASAALTLNAGYDAAFPLATAVTPVGGGTITVTPAPEQGLYRTGTAVTVSAGPSTGYVFRGFTGDLNGTINPQPVVLDRARSVLGQFALGAPSLVAIPGVVNKSASPVTVAVQVMNRGAVPATGARIVSVTNVRVLSGSGAVVPVTQAATLGNIQPGASATGTISFNWPSTATRIQFTVNFSDASGYAGATTVAVFR